MPTISTDPTRITQINVFTVPQGGQDALVALLAEAAASCRDLDGWLSASLHASLDGTRVVNYAQASDEAAMARAFEHLSRNGWIARNAALGTASPGLYRVMRTITR